MAGRRPQHKASDSQEPAAHEWVTVAEAAVRAGVNAVTLRRAARIGNLEARRSGKVWLTTPAAVRAWLKEARHRTGPKPGQGIGRPHARPDAVAAALARRQEATLHDRTIEALPTGRSLVEVALSESSG